MQTDHTAGRRQAVVALGLALVATVAAGVLVLDPGAERVAELGRAALARYGAFWVAAGGVGLLALHLVRRSRPAARRAQRAHAAVSTKPTSPASPAGPVRSAAPRTQQRVVTPPRTGRRHLTLVTSEAAAR